MAKKQGQKTEGEGGGQGGQGGQLFNLQRPAVASASSPFTRSAPSYTGSPKAPRAGLEALGTGQFKVKTTTLSC